jgi:hypothetical protein
VVQRGAGDRAVFDRREREDRIHRQHVLDEGEIGVVVGQVAEGDEAGKQSDGCDRRRLRRADGDHGHVSHLRVTS